MLRLYGYRIFAGEVEKQVQDTRSTARHQDAELAQHGRRAFREGAGKFRASEAQRVQEDRKKDADEGFPMEKRKGNCKRRKCGRARWNGWKKEREREDAVARQVGGFCWPEKRRAAGKRVEMP